MAVLAFQVQADYEKVIRLREEISKLKAEMQDVNPFDDKKTFDNLNEKIFKSTKELEVLTNKAAQAGAVISEDLKKAFQGIDLSNPTAELKAFDEQLLKLCNNLDGYFNNLQGKLQGMLGVLGGGKSVADNITVNENNIARIEAMKQKNTELTEEIKRQQEEIQKQRDAYNQLADAVKSNNVPTLQRASQEHRGNAKELEAEAKNIQAIIEDNNQYISTLESRIAKQEKAAETAKRYVDANNAILSGESPMPAGYNVDDVKSNLENAESRLQAANEKATQLREEMSGVKQANVELSESLARTNNELEAAAQKPVRMRTQIMLAREDLMKMIATGQMGTPMFIDMAKQAGGMRRQMALANAYMSYFANPTKHLAALKTAMQGVAGSASLITGIMGVFNSKSEKMAEIQTKIQSYLAIIVGLETTYASVKKTSMAMMAISELQTWAQAKASAAATAAKTSETGATVALTVAQAAFNAVAKANPYILLIGIISTVIGGIWLLVKALGEESEEQKKAAEAAKKHREEIAKMNEQWAASVASSASKQIAAYEELKRKYNELGDNLNAKKKFINENADAFHDLGFSVNSVTDAENFFVKNTDSVVNAIIARAEAAAYGEMIEDALKEKIRKDKQAEKTVAGGGRYYLPSKTKRVMVPSSVIGEYVWEDRQKTKSEYDADVKQRNDEALKRHSKVLAQNQKEYDEVVADARKGLKESLAKQAKYEKLTGVQTHTPPPKKDKGGSHSSKVPSPEEIKAGQEAAKEAESKNAKERVKMMRDITDTVEQARIAAMKDSEEKVVAQREYNKKKELEGLEQQRQETKDKYIEMAKSEFDAQEKMEKKRNKKYRVKTFDPSTVDTTEIDRQFDKKKKYIEEKQVNEDEKDEKQKARNAEAALIGYIEAYGTLKEKEIGIEMSYNAKKKSIKEDTTKSEKQKQVELLANEKEYQAKLKSLKLEELKKNIDWEYVFGNLEDVDTTTLSVVKDQLKEFIDTSKNLPPDQIKTVVDAMARLQEKMDLSTPIKSIKKARAEYKAAKVEYDKYRKAYDKAKSKGDTEGMDKASKGMIKKSKEMNKANAKGKHGFEAITKTVENYVKALDAVGNTIGGTSGEMLKLGSSAVLAGIGMANGIEQVAKATSALEKSTAILAIIEAAMKAFQIVASLFGGKADETLTNYVETLDTYISLLSNSISKLNDNMGDTKNSMKETIAYYKDLIKMREKEAMAIKSQSQVWLNSGASNGSHSEGIKIVKNMKRNLRSGNAEVRRFFEQGYNSLNEYFKKLNGRYAKSVDDFGRMDWIWRLSKEEIIALSKDMNALSMLGKDLSDDIIKYANSLKSAEEALNDQFAALLNVSYDEFYDDFVDMVSDMDSKSEDFANNFSEYMRKALLKNLIAKKYKSQLEAIFSAAGKYAEDGKLDQHIDELRKQYTDVGEQAKKDQEAIDKIVGGQASRQEASQKGFSAMSQDTANELNGRFTALQVAGECIMVENIRQSETLRLINAKIEDLGTNAPLRNIADESRTILANSYLELVEIRNNTAAIIEPINEMKEVMNDVKRNTSRI